jgi:hypothetical protein
MNDPVVGTKHLLMEIRHLFVVEIRHLLVGTQDLCVQSNKTGSNKTIPHRTDTLEGTLDWAGRKDLASLQTIVSSINNFSGKYEI